MPFSIRPFRRFPVCCPVTYHASPPYDAKGPRTARNSHDRIFWHGGGQLMLAPSATTDGYSATFAIGLQFP